MAIGARGVAEDPSGAALSSSAEGREGVMARFSNARVAETVRPFWAALQAGEFIADALWRRAKSQPEGSPSLGGASAIVFVVPGAPVVRAG